MHTNLYPGIRAGAHLLEVVDARNLPFCLMQKENVLRQNLTCRAVALLLRDREGRTLLRRVGSIWDFSSRAFLAAGQSHEELARDLLRQDWQQEGRRLHLLGLCQPAADAANSFTAVHEARIPSALLRQLGADPTSHLLLDHDELLGVTHHLGDIFSPLLLQALREGLLFPN